MSVLTDLIYGGSHAVAGLTEGAVNDAIAKYGADHPIAFPDTAYFFPTIYAATGVKVTIDQESWEDVRPKAAVAANVGSGPDMVMSWFDDPHRGQHETKWRLVRLDDHIAIAPVPLQLAARVEI
mgnify:CR=1 FL=1